MSAVETISVPREDIAALVAAYRPLVEFCLNDFQTKIDGVRAGAGTTFRKSDEKTIAQLETRFKIVKRLVEVINALPVYESKKDIRIGEVKWGDAAREDDEDDERDDGEDWWEDAYHQAEAKAIDPEAVMPQPGDFFEFLDGDDDFLNLE